MYLCFDLLNSLCGDKAFLFGLALFSLWLSKEKEKQM